jgi:hypothetical protein
MTAPVVAPRAPPATAFAAGSGDCAKAEMLMAIPAISAIALIVFVIIHLLCWSPGFYLVRPGQVI